MNLTGTTQEWNKIVTDRILAIEKEIGRQGKMLEHLANLIATGAIRRQDNAKSFVSIAEQAKAHMEAILTQEQIALVRGKRRDQVATELRRRVVCSLYEKGVSATEISNALEKDHNSVYYHLAIAGMIPQTSKQIKARILTKAHKAKKREMLGQKNN